MIPVFRLADRSVRIVQHCPQCYDTFRQPRFRCPYCGTIHDKRIPGKSGLLFARCNCGHFIPCSALSKRSKLAAVCPKCGQDLAASDAKQFSIQMIGCSGSGKTSFLAAFYHLYLTYTECAVHAMPESDFAELKKLFLNGSLPSTHSSGVNSYSFIHKAGEIADKSLIFYNIPAETLLMEEYTRNPLNFGYSDGIMILIDSLSTPLIRGRCAKSEYPGASSSLEEQESVIIHFINKFSEIAGRSARRMSGVPVAVLLTKSGVEAVKSAIGMSKIKAKYNADPGRYRNSVENARNEICREFLAEKFRRVGEYEKAATAFMPLGTYRDAAKQAEDAILCGFDGAELLKAFNAHSLDPSGGPVCV